MKKATLNLLIMILILVITGCAKNDDIEESLENGQEKNINLEITEFIKSNLNDNWKYSDEKYKIYDNHSVEIVLNNVEEWSYCAYYSNKLMVKLNKDKPEILKQIPTISFICKNEDNKNPKIVYNNISSITIENVESNAKYYDSNNNLIDETAMEGFKKICNSYKYKDIFRNPENYLSKKAKITGEVIQVMEEKDSGIDYWILRVNMTKDKYGYYSDTIMIIIEKNAINGRIIEDDIFTFYGLLREPITYETVFGAQQTVPAMTALYGELIN